MVRVWTLLLALVVTVLASAQEQSAAQPAGGAALDAKDALVRERYEKALLGSPLQEQAFDRIYDSYLAYEGLDAWTTKLKDAVATNPDAAHWILLGRVYARQFKTAEAIDALESAKALGEARPEFQLLLGTIYYDAGRNDDAITLLSSALDTITDGDQRSRVVRLLGSLYLRQGKRDEAMTAWKRLTDQDPNDLFALLELSTIYEENQMWDDVIATQRRIVDASESDPYRKCRALRDIGQALIQQEKYPEAIATFEQALELVAPGNWLFEDLKIRLVTVYQDMGDLKGLSQYVLAKLELNPGDVEFRDLLAETYTRMQSLDLAEAEYKTILERDPKRAGAYEKLILLYERMQKPEQVTATYEKLIELFPTEPDYLRRLGESYLHANKQDLAKQTWQRIVSADATPQQNAQLAEWLEEYEFPDEAISAYEKALAGSRNKEWTFRLGALKHQKGDDEAALTVWTSVLDEATSTAADYAEVASLLDGNNLVEKSEPYLRKAIEKDAQNAEYALTLAKTLMRLERAEEALPLFEQCSAQPDNEYLRDQGEKGMLDAYDATGVLADKQKEWEAAVEANPNDLPTVLKLARVFSRLGDRAKSTALFERAVELDPANMDNLRTLAGVYKSSKQLQECIAVYTKLIENDKDRAGGYYRELLEMYMTADLKTQALDTAQKIVELTPSNAEARLDLAQVLMNYLKYDEALEQYRYALRLEPNEPDYFRQYAEALQSQGRLGEAQEAFRKMFAVAKEDDTRRQAAVMLAGIYQQQNKHQELAQEFQNRIRNTPKRLAAYQDLSAIYTQVGDNVRAIEVLEDALNTVDERVPALQALVRTAYDAQDYPRIISYYEQLLAASGKPSTQELEKLGQVYSDIGEIEKARATWNRITEENPKDPKAYVTLAGALKRAGFNEEALTAQAQALELKPGDYKYRMAYAQDLANAGQSDAAIEQVKKLLDLGDPKAKEEEEKSKEKKVKALNRGRQSSSGYSMYYTGMGYQRIYRSGSRGNSFDDVRREAISMMAGWSQNAMGIDALVEEYKKKVEANPSNIQALKDLMVIYQTVDQRDDAIQTGEQLVAREPDNADMLEQVAQMYVQKRDVEKAVAHLTRLGEMQPLKRKDILLQQLNLYAQSGDEAKLGETAASLTADYGDDYSVLSSIANNLLNRGKFDEVKAMRDRIDIVSPQYRNAMRSVIASAYQRTDELAEAQKLFEEILFSDDDYQRGAVYRRRGRGSLYAPLSIEERQSRGTSRGIYQLSNLGVMSSSNSQAMNTADTLLNKPEHAAASDAVRAKMEEIARGYTTAESQMQRDRAWDMAKMLIALAIQKDEADRARQYLADFKAAGVDDVEWYNLANYLNEKQEKYDDIITLFDELLKRQPHRAKEISMARIKTRMTSEKYPEAAAEIKNLMGQGMPPGDIVAIIRQLDRADQREHVKELTEQLLAQSGRNSEALALLASAYSKQNNYEKAMELAREAWDRKARASSRSYSRYYYSYYSYYPGYQQPDDLLGNLYRYAQGAGKSAELIAEFEDRLAKQPGSIDLHRNLASLYTMNDNVDKALAVWESLEQKRPNLSEAKLARANILEQRGRFQDAIAVYEGVMKSNPSMYTNMSWRVRSLYQRSGQGDKLKALEEDLLAKAKSPDQLQNIANQYQNDGDHEKAIEIYKRVIEAAPDRTWAHSQLASTYADMGRYEDALKSYAEWINSPLTRAQGYVDYYSVAQMVSLYRALGRLPELKTQAEAEFAKNPADRVARALQTEVAIFEKRFSDARALIEESITKHGDQNAGNEMVTVLQYETDHAVIAKALESAQRQGWFNDYEQLGQLYLLIGNQDKAFETWQSMAQNYGGSYGIVRTIERLMYNGMYDKAQDYFAKSRGEFEEWDGREVGRSVINAYFYGLGFSPYIERLKTDKIRGGDERFVRLLLSSNEAPLQWRREFLSGLLTVDPDNKELLAIQAENLAQMEDTESLIPLLQTLCTKDEMNSDYRQRLASALQAAGKEDEAVAMFQSWATQRMTLDRLQPLGSFLQQVRPRDFLALRDQAIEKLDPSQKDDILREAARAEAKLGNIDAARATLLQLFEQRKDADAFNAYFSFIAEHGQYADAHAFLLQYKDEGFIDQWRGGSDRLATVCAYTGDLDLLADLTWKFTRYGDRWNSQYYLENTLRQLGEVGDGGKLLARIEQRAIEDANCPPQVWNALREAYYAANNAEKAREINERLLQGSPQNYAHLTSKAGSLVALRRYDEAIALYQSMPVRSLQEEVSARVGMAITLYAARRDDEARRVIDETRVWATAASVSAQLGQALFNMKDFEKSVAPLERAKLLGSDQNDSRSTLALAYAELGRTEDCLKIAQMNASRGRIKDTIESLTMLGKPDISIQLGTTHLQHLPGDREVRIEMAKTFGMKGDPASALKTLSEGYGEVIPRGKREYIDQCARMLIELNLVDAAAAQFAAAPEPLMDAALATAFRMYAQSGKAPLAQTTRERIAPLAIQTIYGTLAMGDALKELGDKPAAAEWYKKAIAAPDIQRRDKTSIVMGLFACDDASAALSLVEEIAQGEPSTWYTQLSFIPVVAKAAPDKLPAALERVKAIAPYDSQFAFFEMLGNYYSGRQELAGSALISLIDAPNLTIEQRFTVAELLHRDSRKQECIRACDRLLSAGYEESEVKTKIFEMVKWFTPSEPALATKYSLRSWPARVNQSNAIGNLVATLAPDRLPDVKAAVIAAIQENPQHERVSDFAGFYKEASELCGVPESAAGIAEAAGVTGVELEESRAWDKLIEDWSFSGLRRSINLPWSNRETDAAIAASGFDAVLNPAVSSKVVTKQDALGVIDVAQALNVTNEQTRGQEVFAASRLSSPDEREVLIGAGFTENARVWINGESVYDQATERSVRPNKVRFRAKLKAGDNAIIIRIGTRGTAPQFCFGIQEGGDGVTSSAVSSAAPATVAAAG